MTITEREEAVRELIRRLDRAVQPGEVRAIAESVKRQLEEFCHEFSDPLPERFQGCRPEGYARRLLHRDPDGRYTAVVMTWGPGQATELHDHAGIWCVECVLVGQLEVTQYDLVARDRERYRFEQRQRMLAGVGSAGCLIPPFEYHTLANALADRPTMTLHIYGGEMDHCSVYRPAGSGWWGRIEKQLEYAN